MLLCGAGLGLDLYIIPDVHYMINLLLRYLLMGAGEIVWSEMVKGVPEFRTSIGSMV